MRSGWLVALLLMAAWMNAVAIPAACGSHGLTPAGMHMQLSATTVAISSIHTAPAPCTDGTEGRSGQSSNLFMSSECGVCHTQASGFAMLVDPSWPVAEPTSVSAPEFTTIYLPTSTKPPTFHS
ncbi:DUF2946 family protein [Candidatus Acetothermia bacterium]|nr:DUF2946 family protein [Candidatus Acetothermia bacterium]